MDYKYRNFNEDYIIISKSDLFDSEWYLSNYDINVDVDPLKHFLLEGSPKFYNPSPNFDVQWYLTEYNDVKKVGIHPLVHYIRFGRYEGRFPKPYLFDLKYKRDFRMILRSGLFDKGWFSSFYSLGEDIDPIYYYLEHGVELGLNPSPDFDTMWYLEEYGGDLKQGMNPFVHFIKYGIDNHLISKLYDFDEINRLKLNKTIKGKNNYLFLINDTNNEIRQHFDNSFINKFKYIDFIRDYYFKKYLFEKMNLKYYYFVVPDKSVVCKDFIPFKYEVIKRNATKFNVILDFKDNLTHSDYWRYDSHINLKGAKKLVFDYINHIDGSFTKEQYENLINECIVLEITEKHDLLSALNWSYTEKEKKKIKPSKTEVYLPKINKLKIPEEFLKCKKRDSEYFYNPHSVTNLRVLIFRDSSTKFLKFYLSLYFREIFLYWDHLELNKELIEWFKPDIILEIRTERFIENYFTPVWIQELMLDK